jgi:hypothetical protein
MRSTTPSEPLLLRAWTRAGWPLLAIPAGGIGLVAAEHQIGLAVMVVLFTAMTLAVWVSVATVVSDLPGVRVNALRIGVASGFVVTVMAGWTEISSSAGVVVPLLLVVTSPPAVRLALGAARRHRRSHSRRTDLPPRVLMDKEMVDRRFGELVRDLEESGDNRDG